MKQLVPSSLLVKIDKGKLVIIININSIASHSEETINSNEETMRAQKMVDTLQLPLDHRGLLINN